MICKENADKTKMELMRRQNMSKQGWNVKRNNYNEFVKNNFYLILIATKTGEYDSLIKQIKKRHDKN